MCLPNFNIQILLLLLKAMTNSKSRSTHSLANPATNLNNTLNNNNTNNNNEQGFYQNLSVYRNQNQNQSQPILSER